MSEFEGILERLVCLPPTDWEQEGPSENYALSTKIVVRGRTFEVSLCRSNGREAQMALVYAGNVVYREGGPRVQTAYGCVQKNMEDAGLPFEDPENTDQDIPEHLLDP